MRLQFQKTISTSSKSFPIAIVVAVLLWLFLPVSSVPSFYGKPAYWPMLLGLSPFNQLTGGAIVAILAVYIMVELNHTHILLRVSSRMLGSVLVLLLAIAIPLHVLQQSDVVLITVLLAYSPLFASYQNPLPSLAFATMFLMSLASLLVPEWLFMVPFYVLLQAFLRAFTLQTLMASLLGLLLPYWFWAAWAVHTDNLPIIWEHFRSLQDVFSQPFSLSPFFVTPCPPAPLLFFMLLLFLVGTFDLFQHQFLDKTRTRSILKAVVYHGFAIIGLMLLLPHRHLLFFPAFVVDTAILFGHFFTLTYTRFSHILNIVLLFCALLSVYFYYSL